ncbi:NUDIX hydrolase [Alkaliphilus hydrothermalis]|uniref:8-oxo-dGTP diphosphatase n=1 Tax=Alkaliphilus hydrothermalis TaxID=1482730 RepID=A0ABS2NNG6_9FIRM|nr:NUDIX domain-containing protein [Alkaliphilus hydrothermalis]MBM7614124.1 8-oxo-dGTP diphosphatase [Alkaliphilus hydrothermalis]
MKVEFYELGSIADEKLAYAVIGSIYGGKHIFVKHKDRDTWEIPGGHREDGEEIEATGKRELVEETGAVDYSITPICEYSVTRGDVCSYGRLFYSEVFSFGQLPDLEIGEVRCFKETPENLTYPDIQPYLLKKILDLVQKSR